MQIQRIDTRNFALWREQIATLLDQSVKMNFPGFPIDASYGIEKCRQLEMFLKDGTAVVFAAIEGEKLVGWVWCHSINRLGKRRLHIAEIAVAEDCQRRGVGHRLLSEAEEYAACNDYCEIDLLVTASNSNAVMFYEKASYTPERFLMKKAVKKPRNETPQDRENEYDNRICIKPET